MHIFWMLLIGLAVGMGAGLLLRTRGFAAATTLGIVGSCAAGLLGRALGCFQGPVNVAGITASVFGAVGALVVYGILARRFAGGPN
jgi:uncharacterized membrane protein YeaQ/YmgE (transglycosylase-associated protein family)